MLQKKLSICIPTYNRASYIKRLLQNISNESYINIEVVVVIDGSVDDTLNVVKGFYDKFDMQIFEQANQGRSVALKKAIELAKGEYILIMDDEDLFIEGAFKALLARINEIEVHQKVSNKEIIGVVFLTQDVNGDLIGNRFPSSPLISNLVAVNSDYKSKGDKKQIIKSKLLKKVLYDTYPNERRMSTYVLWSRLATEFNVVFYNEIIVIKEYLNEGLSKNINKVRMGSPQSSRLIYKELLELHSNVYISKLFRLKNAINFYRYNFHCKVKESVKSNFSYKCIGFIFGYFYYKLDELSKK